jgi:hypothetical protein
MRVARKERGQVLIILAASWLLLGGGGSSALVVLDRPASEIKKDVKRVITDGGRRELILRDISQWESVHKKQDENVKVDREALLKALRRKDTRRSETQPVLAELDKTFLIMDWDFLNLRFRVKERVTSAEWAEIVAKPNR